MTQTFRTEVTYVRTETREFEVEARDAEEAYRIIEQMALAVKPEGHRMNLDSVETDEKLFHTIGICEASGRPIFEGSDYEMYEDGIMCLKEYSQ